jgi:hypothetical protein
MATSRRPFPNGKVPILNSSRRRSVRVKKVKLRPKILPMRHLFAQTGITRLFFDLGQFAVVKPRSGREMPMGCPPETPARECDSLRGRIGAPVLSDARQ